MGNCIKSLGIDRVRAVFVDQHDQLTKETEEIETRLRVAVDQEQRIENAISALKSQIVGPASTSHVRKLKDLMSQRALAETTSRMYSGRLNDITKSRQSLNALEHVAGATKRYDSLQRSVKKLGLGSMDQLTQNLDQLQEAKDDLAEISEAVQGDLSLDDITDEDVLAELARSNNDGDSSRILTQLAMLPSTTNARLKPIKESGLVEVVYGRDDDQDDTQIALEYP